MKTKELQDQCPNDEIPLNPPYPPCINCITLPICKSIIKDYYNRQYSARYILIMLYRKCSLLKEYVNNSINSSNHGLFNEMLEHPHKLELLSYYMKRNKIL